MRVRAGDREAVLALGAVEALTPFLDDWPARFQSTVDGVTLLRHGAFAGWRWTTLGGYSIGTDLNQSLTLIGDLTLHLSHGSHGRGTAVEIVGEPLDRDDAVRVQKQDRERRALLRPTETDRPIAVQDLERPKDPELEHSRGR